MPRYRLTLEYAGGPFRGWQRQGDEPTVQGALEAALAPLAGGAVAVVGAGRTDAGVHALGQVAHLDLERAWEPGRLLMALNARLRPLPVAVLAVEPAAPDFHARFDAIQRHYVYRILNRRAPPTIDLDRVWYVPVPLSAELMHEAGQALVGRHDFTSFRSSECQAKSPVKTLDRLHVRRRGELIEIRAAARSFLHHQMRNIAGTLAQVGSRREPVGFVAEVLRRRDRREAGATAPAAGLFLERVDYPVNIRSM